MFLKGRASSKNSPRFSSNDSLVSSINSKNSEIKLQNSSGLGILKLEVADTGIGMSVSQQSKLFQPFGQADSSISREYGGTGLGLWISRQMAQISGGDISLYSKEGRGSSFLLCLPVQCSPEQMVVGDEEDEEEKCLNSENIIGKCLYVEDIEDNQVIMKKMIDKNTKLKVTLAPNGLKASQLYRKAIDKSNPFQIVITDLRLPVRSGQSLISDIRSFESTYNLDSVPIIVLTGDPSENEKYKCIHTLKANAFLTKPVNKLELLKNIRNLLKPNLSSRSLQDLNQHDSSERRIIIVEDESLLSSLFRGFVMSLGKHITVNVYASISSLKLGIEEHFLPSEQPLLNSNESVEDIRKGIDVLLLDSTLPDGSGKDVLSWLLPYLRMRGKSPPKVLSMSGNSIEDKKILYEGFQICSFLQKPFSREELLGVMNLILHEQ